jgi:phage shock protein A
MQERSTRNEQRMADFEAQARQHLAAGREDLARVALERKRLGVAQAAEFERELASLAHEQTQLLRAEARLEAKIETFRMRRDVLRSQRASAEAQARISEAYGGVTEESRDVAYTVRRIESHTAELRSRGAAAEQMLDDGLVEGVEDPQARFERKLAMSEVDDDLARLQREMDAEAGSR